MSKKQGREGGVNLARGCVWVALATTLLIAHGGYTLLFAEDFRGVQFMGFEDLSEFSASVSCRPSECILVSPVIRTGIPWDELIPSWNLATGSSAELKIEVRPVFDDETTTFYNLGLWSTGTAGQSRKSMSGQNDEYATVLTDTLVLKKRGKGLQLRLTLSNSTNTSSLKFLSICVRDSLCDPAPLEPCHTAWGKKIPVPERSQMAYPRGEELCSPTTLSMLLAFWADKLHRPDLCVGVPEIQTAVYDETWKGTGNWAFNTAYAGSFPGMRAYVARFSDLSELEEWVACGIPVGLSVCYNKLRGKSGGPSGHLVVCVGFTKTGDPIINDPGTSQHVRKIFRRENLIAAWRHSHNAVYLVYAQDTRLPKDRFGHWSLRF